ncbi:hypothetical protein CH370_13355 [Leptospira kmetyi]|uniref:Uncharacterized protein n=1 Tax=Leptospira kmetyi TaxID=408139 RepID=A0AAD0UTV5_9LEPT|nr:hypothetical protein EFP84_11740 [Leptospira kmetyi]EQA54045.1 hypothetical protein LEP1GSC052_3739 [Leptospira kmetyi serovar Malaysia str. Bejo-Iso9]PJZ27674.1 hypothetical protein CH378_21885 [Leptospira kmetyi]PJZ41213.1 hypothetical protein CH370_13355 [Leptospira kmetyi]
MIRWSKNLETREDLRELIYWKVESTLKRFEYDFQFSNEPIQVLRHTYAQEIANLIFDSFENK